MSIWDEPGREAALEERLDELCADAALEVRFHLRNPMIGEEERGRKGGEGRERRREEEEGEGERGRKERGREGGGRGRKGGEGRERRREEEEGEGERGRKERGREGSRNRRIKLIIV